MTSALEETRKTGINVVGAVPWGTHLCQFYNTKQDLIDILVPYLKAGLEHNEFCIWVTAGTLNEKEAEEALRKVVPDFAQYLERGQIEIIPYTEWYLKKGVFNRQRTLNDWIDKLKQALDKGYDGMRVTGDMTWLGEKDWKNFTDYEEEVNNVIGKYHMLAICTYAIDKCGAREIIDVESNHQFALVRQAGKWILLKSGESPKMPTRGGLSILAEQRLLTPLQERFIYSGFHGLDDQEIIELLFSLARPPGECKRLAKQCIEHFKSLRGFLSASPDELKQYGLKSPCLFCIKLLHELPEEVLKQKIVDQPVNKSSQEVFDYLYYSMRDLKKEVFKVIYLNSRNQIIDTEVLFEGTIEDTPVHPREIIEGAIKHDAVRLIFVHNHPSGDPTPSKSDKQLTRDLVFIGNVTQIKVLDHLIIGENRYFSFADAGLIKKYEDDFLNIRIKRMLEASQYISPN